MSSVLSTITVKLEALRAFYGTRPEPMNDAFIETLTDLWDDIAEFVFHYTLNAEMVDDYTVGPVLEFLNCPEVLELGTQVEEFLAPYRSKCPTCGETWQYEGDGTAYCEACEEQHE